MKNNAHARELLKSITELTSLGETEPVEYYPLIVSAFDSWRKEKTDALKQLLTEWELEVPDDDSLYTLGIRRAIDIINDEKPTL